MKEKDKKKGDFLIPEEALSKIKSQSELDDFFTDLYKQAVEGMLKAELDDQSAMKAVYLAVNNIQQKWSMPIRSWGIIINQFIIKFGDRCQI